MSGARTRAPSRPRLAALLARSFAALARRRRETLAARRLSEAPDWLLRDIGLSRHEIERAVRGERRR